LDNSDVTTSFTRRRALAVGGGTAASLLASRTGIAMGHKHHPRHRHAEIQSGKLPLDKIGAILEADGDVQSGVVHFSIDRDDAGTVMGPQGVEFSGSFEINGDLYFQPLKHGNRAFFNGDLALSPGELNPVIDAIIANGLTFQAMHQHYFGLAPMWWFIHFRGVGRPLHLAKAVKGVLNATASPFPQKTPANPSTPLDAKRLAKILNGTSSVGSNGVVTVDVSRKDKTVIDGVLVSPEANISTNIEFKPMPAAGSNGAAGAPDFSLLTSEVMPVTRVMRAQGWDVHCLYNQETGESPQHFFSHMLKTGDAYALAHEIRKGLDRTDSD
jgi:hypothetical protein